MLEMTQICREIANTCREIGNILLTGDEYVGFIPYSRESVYLGCR